MSDSETYGPPLPPGFEPDPGSDSDASSKGEESSANLVIGPQCPTSFLKRKHSENGDDSKSDSCENSRQENRDSNFIGPALPPGFTNKAEYSDSDDDECTVGPMPAASLPCDESVDDVIVRIENRAKNMKKQLEGGNEIFSEKPRREEWMTVPNTTSKNQLGALSRCLSDKKTSEKRSSAYKNEYKDSRTCRKRHEEEDEKVKESKAKQQKSLLEIHQKSLEKKKKKKEKDKEKKGSSELAERKPFDRDELAVRLMSKSQVDSVIKKAKYLDSRFSAGASKYL